MRQWMVAVGLLLGAGAVQAVEVSDVWTRATPPGAKLSAAFFSMKGEEAGDRLIKASTPAAGRVEIHESRMDGEIMRMRELSDGLAVAAGQEITLAPGGIHLMLLDLPAPLVEGESIALTLQFEQAGAITVQAEVRAPGAASHDHHHHH